MSRTPGLSGEGSEAVVVGDRRTSGIGEISADWWGGWMRRMMRTARISMLVEREEQSGLPSFFCDVAHPSTEDASRDLWKGEGEWWNRVVRCTYGPSYVRAQSREYQRRSRACSRAVVGRRAKSLPQSGEHAHQRSGVGLVAGQVEHHVSFPSRGIGRIQRGKGW